MFEPTELEWHDYIEGVSMPPDSAHFFGDTYSVKCLVIDVDINGANVRLARLRHVPAEEWHSDDWQWIMDGRDSYYLNGVIRWAAVTLPEEK